MKEKVTMGHSTVSSSSSSIDPEGVETDSEVDSGLLSAFGIPARPSPLVDASFGRSRFGARFFGFTPPRSTEAVLANGDRARVNFLAEAAKKTQDGDLVL